MKQIIITNVPYRKKKCLCIFKEPNIYEKVAVFSSNEQAEKFAQYLADYVVENISEAIKGAM